MPPRAGLCPVPAVKMSKQSWSFSRSASKSRSLRETALAPPSPESYPPHPVDLVKSPQISAVAAAAGLDCGQSSVAPPSDVPKSSEKEKRNRESESSWWSH